MQLVLQQREVPREEAVVALLRAVARPLLEAEQRGRRAEGHLEGGVVVGVGVGLGLGLEG